MNNRVVLITGAAKRLGAVIAKQLHEQGFKVVIHYHHSKKEAEDACNSFNTIRKDSAAIVHGNIDDIANCQRIIQEAYNIFEQLDALINNASSFYPTPVGSVNLKQWDDLLGSNLKGPFFLSQAAAPFLKRANGNIINITDIHGERPLKNYPVYSIAKAGLIMLTKSLARELGPSIRVNAIAPGPILWPNEKTLLSDTAKEHIIEKTCLKRKGTPQDIAQTVLFLLEQGYITGQVIAVDGGRTIK